MTTLFHNATFYTRVAEGDRAEAIVVDDNGALAFVGSLDEARRQAPGAETVDLEGATVLPCFIDPHGHFGGSMQYVLYADLSLCTSFEDIQRVIREFIAERNVGPDGMVMATGYDQNELVEGRHPNKSVLDAVSTEVPILAVHASNHMAVANSLLLDMAGIDASMPDPEGGRFGRVAGTQEPDGYAEEPDELRLQRHRRRHAARVPRARHHHLPGRRHPRLVGRADLRHGRERQAQAGRGVLPHARRGRGRHA